MTSKKTKEDYRLYMEGQKQVAKDRFAKYAEYNRQHKPTKKKG